MLGVDPLGFGVPLETSSEPIIDIAPPLTITRDEAVKLGAIDTEFFAKTFFPRTFRHASPTFSHEIWNDLDDPTARYVNLKCFRGSAKTTRLRTFCAKRIAYRVSRTALFIGANEGKAAQSIQWLRGQIERNLVFANTFGLRPGKKWHELELEIECWATDANGREFLDHVTWIQGVGMTASFRGLNFDDYRPDLIVADDIVTDENVLTEASRDKLADLLLGAAVGALVSTVDEPNAKFVLAQTPLHPEDVSELATRSSVWRTSTYPCWSHESEHLPDAEKRSTWETYYPSVELRQKKLDYISMGKLHIFLREFECKLTSPGQERLHPEHIQFYDDSFVPSGTTIISVDPVPPPSDNEVKKNLHDRDFEAIVVQTRSGPNYYLREYHQSRGHNPDWTVNMLFELGLRYRPLMIVIESVAYQSALKWYFEKEMSRKGMYFVVHAAKDTHKKKFTRIVNAFSSVVNQKRYFIRKAHSEFLSDFTVYPKVSHDDLLDAGAMGLLYLVHPIVEIEESTSVVTLDESQYEDLDVIGGCP